MQTVLVTGGTGFVGSRLRKELNRLGYSVILAGRSKPTTLKDNECFIPLDLSTEFNLTSLFQEKQIDTVIHLGGHAHVMTDTHDDSLLIYRKVNAEGTERLARQTATAGVSRFVFLSSIKVNGERTLSKAFTEEVESPPLDNYALSKFEGEQALIRICSGSSMSYSIIRCPLIYGPGVKANFLQLIRFVEIGTPLPLKAIQNRRSMIGLDNLSSALIACAQSPKAANQIFLVSDDRVLSTGELIELIAHAFNKPSRLWSCPPALLHVIGKMTGQSEKIRRLTESLEVDGGKIRNMVGWKPPVTTEQAVTDTIRWYLSSVSRK